MLYFVLFFSSGIRVADQLLCDGAGQHCVGPGALQWPEGGENFKEPLSVHRTDLQRAIMRDKPPV